MKSFIYTYTEQSKVPTDGSGRKKTVKIWQVVRNEPKLLGEVTDTFVNEHQLVFQALEQFKALPARFFAKDANNGRRYTVTALQEQGVARIHSL